MDVEADAITAPQARVGGGRSDVVRIGPAPCSRGMKLVSREGAGSGSARVRPAGSASRDDGRGDAHDDW